MEELDIGREFGASSYMVFKLIESYPSISTPELIEELGISKSSAQETLIKLELSNIVTSEKIKGKKIYRVNRTKDWRLN